MEETKTVKQWEKEHNVILLADLSQAKKVTREEFRQSMIDDGFTGINFEDREKFLVDNGYEVTRKNMLDSNLSHRSDDETTEEDS